MNIKGGYAIVDFKGTSLTYNTPSKIDGIYDQVVNAFNRSKPVVLSNLTLNNGANHYYINSTFVGCYKLDNESIMLFVGTTGLMVASNDNVTAYTFS